MPRFADESIAGPGLLLRPLVAGDVPAIAQACNDPQIQTWIPLPNPYTADDARLFIEQHGPELIESGRGIARAIEVAGRLCGAIDLSSTDWPARSTEVGYWIAPWARGQSLATRALMTLTEWAFSQGMRRVQVRVALDNTASLLTAERGGFRREGVLRAAGYVTGGPVDLVMLSRLPSDPAPATV